MKKEKKRGAEYYEKCAKKVLEQQKSGVLTMKVLGKIFEDLDKEIGFKSKGKRSHSLNYNIKDEFKASLNGYWGETVIEKTKMGLDDKEKTKIAKGYWIKVDPKDISQVNAVMSRIKSYFASKEKSSVSKKQLETERMISKAGPITQPTITEDEKRFRDYILARALQLEEDENNLGHPTTEAIEIIKAEVGRPIKKETCEGVWKVLCHVKYDKGNKVLLSNIASLVGWKTFAIKNLEDWKAVLAKFEVQLEYDVPNLTGHGRKNVYFKKVQETMNKLSSIALKLFDLKLMEEKPNFATKKVETVTLSKPVEIVTENWVEKKDDEKYIAFIAAGLLKQINRVVELDDLLKMFKESTYIRYKGDKRDLQKLLKSYPSIFDCGGERVWKSQHDSFEIAKDECNPAEIKRKVTLISGSGITEDDIKIYFSDVKTEYEYNGVSVYTVIINKSYHDMLNFLDLMKILRDGRDKIVTDRSWMNMIEQQAKIERGRRMVRQSSATVGYNADLTVYEIEKAMMK